MLFNFFKYLIPSRIRKSFVRLEKDHKILLALEQASNLEFRQLQNIKKENIEIKALINNLEAKLLKIEKSSSNIVKLGKELDWANIFHDATNTSSWLENRAFTPGRWAVGYPTLYVMYRILNEIRPKNILELGLGQTTRMIAQYAKSKENIKHYVAEHDASWIDFFLNGFEISKNTKIIQFDLNIKPFLEATEVRVYNNFSKIICNEIKNKEDKFDFICIDAPFGYDMKEYSRIDVLDLIPQHLAKSFVIILDDYDRKGEKGTIAILEAKLKENEIEYCKGVYSGAKDVIVLTSIDLKFITSL